MTRAGKRDAAPCGRSRFLAAAALLAGGVLQAGAPPAAEAAGEAAVGRAPAPACPVTRLVANSAERLGPTEVRITVINEGPRPCTLRGHPTVALAGQGSPDRNTPLVVRRLGAAKLVLLPVGGTAETRISFTPVLGEAGGYCESGDEPTVAPSMVLGVADGLLQLAPEDGGDFALCGTVVRATAFRASS
ncbi:DUF4232 domain-containing protein [Streptomyces sp. BR123]|uniref:DUF4232 domain-containing protein n=1 Tax=Streptomyces sp. BR123 TaxID=2749828 RepID=UPI0015C47211|nr:DUF4232 domain-containing protein [Streptomyces sp. BR123]NXY95369.1 DUF4232 domain-containing protein [Streptomyces sp. BR123]